jgi:hypothetical protein
MPVETHAPKIVNRAATSSPAAASRSVQCQPVRNRTAPHVQASLKVSSPKDPAEKEADATASKIMRMAVPEGSVAYVRTESGGVFRQVKGEEKEKKLQRFESPYIARFAGCIPMRKAEGQPNVASNVAAEIQSSTAGGSPLPLSVRRFMEPRFRADFSKVRIHTDAKAAKLNRQVNARAFAVGNSIFFGESNFKPDTHEGRELIAHELTHTVQQGAAVQRSEEADVTQRSPVQVQRLGLSDALDYFADRANLIPGFRMFTIVLGLNPINMSRVDRNAANILRALIEFIPGGGLITRALDNYGIFDKIGTWVEQQIRSLGMVGSAIKQAVTQFLNTLSWTDIFDLGGVWERAKRIFTEPIDRIISFAKGLVTGIIQFIKDAILRPIAKLAEGTAGYELLKGVLGYDPITGDAVPRTAESLLGPFMKLIGQEEIWQNMKKSKATARCWAWFQGALGGLMGFVREIPGLFIRAFKSLELMDIILVPLAFVKLGKVFGSFLGRFISWAGGTIWNLLEIIFDAVSPGAWGYVKKTGAALRSILKNPLPFVGNLVKAAKLGFLNFGANFLGHLKRGLIDWLTGSLPGVYIPKALSLPEVGKFALSVLGITWAQIRAKIVKALGPGGEKIMAGLEVAFDVVKALVTGGPAAAWEIIKDKLNDLKDQVISGITNMVVVTVVSKAVPKLIAMFIPGAGFISAIISIYDTIMVFVRKISKIIQVVTGFINSIVAIAAGNIAAAAAKVESVLGGLISLAISFLAGFVGLGKVADKIMGIVKKVQTAVDKALDAAIAWIIGKAKALFGKLFGGKDKKDDRTDAQKQADLNAGLNEANTLVEAKGATDASIRKGLAGIKSKYRMTSLELVVDIDGDLEASIHVAGKVNPEGKGSIHRIQKDGTVGPLGIKREMLKGWTVETLKELLKDKVWDKFKKAGSKFKEAGLAVRHKVSISDVIKNTDDAIRPKKPDPAAQLLADKGHPVAGTPKTKPKIRDSSIDYLNVVNQDTNNLFVGDAHINSSLVKEQYDAADGDWETPEDTDYRKNFVETWGFKGEEFVITVQRKSRRLKQGLVKEKWKDGKREVMAGT